MPKRLNIAALAIACIALFVALGGTSYAAKVLIGPKQLKQNAVTTKKIKNGHVRTADIMNGGIEMTDLSGPLQAQVQSNFEPLDNAVTSAKVAPNTLTADDLGTNSVDSDEIAGSAVTDAELASNAVDSNEIENGSLNAPDVGQYSGSVSRNFASIDAGECARRHRSHAGRSEHLGPPGVRDPGNRLRRPVHVPHRGRDVHADHQGLQSHGVRRGPRRCGRHDLQLHRVRLSKTLRQRTQ